MEPKRTNYSSSSPSRSSFSLGMDDYAQARSSSTSNSGATAARQQSQALKMQPAAQNSAVPTAPAMPTASSVPVIVQKNNPSQVAPLKPAQQTYTPLKTNNTDGFHAPVSATEPKRTITKPASLNQFYATAQEFSFKRYINTLLNTGLYNPGSKALSLALLSLKLSVIANLTPRTDLFKNQPGSALRAATIELFNLGKFSVEHAETNDSKAALADDGINEAALGLSLASIAGKKDASPIQKSSHKLKLGEIISGISSRAHQKRNHIKAVVAASIACGIIVVSGGFMYANSRNLPEGNISSSVSLYVNSATVQNQSEQAPVSQDQNSLKPNHFKISSLNIDAPAITVGLTNDNAVDVPQQLTDVAWFNGSALPGKPGVTFMVGHYAAGYGGVFDNLTKIKDGDIIEMTDADNNVFKYKVTEKTKQKVADINMDNLLNSSPGENKLVIMTCAGSYIAQNYTDRFIVTATPVN